MNFSEDDLLPISALQHLLYCDRQCALIHIEQVWAENSLTVHGRHLHEKADSGKANRRRSVESVRSLALRSLKWGLIGKADVVEFSVESEGVGKDECNAQHSTLNTQRSTFNGRSEGEVFSRGVQARKAQGARC